MFQQLTTIKKNILGDIFQIVYHESGSFLFLTVVRFLTPKADLIVMTVKLPEPLDGEGEQTVCLESVQFINKRVQKNMCELYIW